MGKKKAGRKKSGMKMPNIRISNKTLTVIACVLAAVCLVAGGIYIDTFHGDGKLKELFSQKEQTTFSEAEENATMGSMAVDISSKAAMAVFEKEFMLCTKDGVKYFASMGDHIWTDTFNMTSPTMIHEGDYVAVGDMGGKTVRVYDRSGMLYDLQAEGSPVQFGLNEKGYLSLITKNGDSSYRIRIYNTKGTLLKERVEESNGVYPLCSDVSDDSKVFAVTYLDTTDISPIGRIVFFYIDAEEGGNHTDSMFAAVEKTDEIIPLIAYMKDGVLAAISDANVYGIGTDGAELWSYPLENTIDQAALSMKEYIVLALGDSVANKDGREKGTICWLDAKGKEKASFESGESVTYLQSSGKGVIFGNDRRYTGVSHSGNENWTYTATGDLTDLIPMEKLNIVMTVGKEMVSICDMSKAQTLESGESRADIHREEQKQAEKDPAEENDPVEEKEPVDDTTSEEDSSDNEA